MLRLPSTVEIWTHPIRWQGISFPRWSISSWLTSVSCCQTPRDSAFRRVPALGQLPVRSLKRPSGGQMAWRGGVTAPLACATNSRVESQKPSLEVHPIAHAAVILSSSDRSTVTRLQQTTEYDRGSNWQVPGKIVLPFSW